MTIPNNISTVDMNNTYSVNGKDLSSINIQNITGMNITKQAKLKKTAQEFESVFIAQLLNTIDSTVEKSGFMSGGKIEERFKSMMNQYVAQDIASSPNSNFGLAKQIYEQMKNAV